MKEIEENTIMNEYNDTTNNNDKYKEKEDENVNEINKIIPTKREDFSNDEKTVSIAPDQMDVDKTESILQSNNNSDKKQLRDRAVKNNLNLNETNLFKEREIVKESFGNNKKKRAPVVDKKDKVVKDGKGKDWGETCYVCGEYGDLLCCDTCTNVAHLFCACLDVS
jgi:hypothetical protein